MNGQVDSEKGRLCGEQSCTAAFLVRVSLTNLGGRAWKPSLGFGCRFDWHLDVFHFSIYISNATKHFRDLTKICNRMVESKTKAGNTADDQLPNYEEIEIDFDQEAPATGAAAAAAAASGASKPTTDNVGVHSTSFKDMVLRPELQQSIVDCGFEHPSDVQQKCIP